MFEEVLLLGQVILPQLGLNDALVMIPPRTCCSSDGPVFNQPIILGRAPQLYFDKKNLKKKFINVESRKKKCDFELRCQVHPSFISRGLILGEPKREW